MSVLCRTNNFFRTIDSSSPRGGWAHTDPSMLSDAHTFISEAKYVHQRFRLSREITSSTLAFVRREATRRQPKANSEMDVGIIVSSVPSICRINSFHRQFHPPALPTSITIHGCFHYYSRVIDARVNIAGREITKLAADTGEHLVKS